MSLQNSTRAQAKLIVSLSPGIHLRKLQELLGTSFSTARYHVGNLERDGEIVRSKDGRYDRLFPAGTADASKTVYTALQNKSARKILQALSDNRMHSVTNGDLSEQTHLSRSTISECIGHLSSVTLVRRYLTPDGRIFYELQNREEVSRLLAIFERNMLNLAADAFIDLWDF